MVKIKIVSGPHADKEREVLDGKYMGVEVAPMTLFVQLTKLGSRWEIDLSSATRDEALEWARADLCARYIRALFEGRAVFFGGAEYRAATAADVSHVAQKIEDILVTSGYHVAVASDDEKGVVIVTGERENKLQ